MLIEMEVAMFPRDADVRRALKRYPDVTCDERRALRSWYHQADAVELLAALNDPSLEQPLEQLQRDHRPTIAASAAALAVPLLLILAAAALT